MTILEGSEMIQEIVRTQPKRQRNTPTYTLETYGSLICVPSMSMMSSKKYPSKGRVAEPQ